MKALTIKQPWASLIMSGAKTVENRSRPTTRRGRIAVHAGKSRSQFRDQPAPASMPFGALLGTVEIVDCVHVDDLGDEHDRQYVTGPWCWIVADPRPFDEPVARSGALSFWEAGEL